MNTLYVRFTPRPGSPLKKFGDRVSSCPQTLATPEKTIAKIQRRGAQFGTYVLATYDEYIAYRREIQGLIAANTSEQLP